MNGREKNSTSLLFGLLIIRDEPLTFKNEVEPKRLAKRYEGPSSARSSRMRYCVLSSSLARKWTFPPYQSGYLSLKPNPAKGSSRKMLSSMSSSSHGDYQISFSSYL